MLRDFSAFFKSKLPLFPSTNAATAGIQAMIENHLVLVAEDEKGIAGFIAGFIGPHPFNSAITVLSEAFWWVRPEARYSRAGLLLIDGFVRWGKEHADWITFALEADSPVREDVLTRRGFALKEKSYLMEVQREAS